MDGTQTSAKNVYTLYILYTPYILYTLYTLSPPTHYTHDSSISFTKALLYEDLAELLPKPAFYWPLAIYPVVGSIGVSALTYWRGDSIKVGVDSIAKSIGRYLFDYIPLFSVPNTQL